MCVQNLELVALPIPEIAGSTQKIWAVAGYAHAAFSTKSKGVGLIARAISFQDFQPMWS